MNRRLLAWIIGGAVVLIGAGGVLVATAEHGSGPAFIAGDRAVTEDQVRQELQSEGYSDVQIVRQGRYFEATGSKDGAITKISVDSQSGRLRADDDDDND